MWISLDVGAATDTHAVYNDGQFELHGYKWFTSAITSDMTLTLARINNTDGDATEGSRGLSMFYVELRDAQKKLNGIQGKRDLQFFKTSNRLFMKLC